MNVYIGKPVVISDMQGPAHTGFHVPLITEWEGLKTIMDSLSLTTGDNWRINLHMPLAGDRYFYNSNLEYQGSLGSYASSSPYVSGSLYKDRFLYLSSSNVNTGYYSDRANGYTIRCFKNLFEKPTSSWTVITGTLGGAGIFWNQTDGLISITSDGTTGYTIQDKNLGATTVYNNGDTLSESNCGKYYQWGNNYGFAWTGSVTTSSTQLNASTYGPGNYYSSSTFIIGNSDWSSVHNDNLRGGVTQGTSTKRIELKNAYIGEVYEYSYDFRNKTLSSVTSDGWTVSEGSFDSSFGSNGLHGGTSWNVLTKTTNKTLSSTSIINIETNVNITSTTYGQTNVGLIMGGTNEIFLSIYYNGSQDWDRLSIDGTNYGQYVSHSAGDKKMICKIDLGNKTYNATIGSTNITGSLSSTQVSNLINKTLSIKCVAKDEYVKDISVTIEN